MSKNKNCCCCTQVIDSLLTFLFFLCYCNLIKELFGMNIQIKQSELVICNFTTKGLSVAYSYTHQPMYCLFYLSYTITEKLVAVYEISKDNSFCI